MIVYKVRRKSDGLYFDGWLWKPTGSFYVRKSAAEKLFNRVLRSYKSSDNPYNYELVTFELTEKEIITAKAFELRESKK